MRVNRFHRLLAACLLLGSLTATTAAAQDAGAGPRVARKKPAPSPLRLRFIGLAQDPAHGKQITRCSFREAWIGLRLEKAGVLVGPITRDSSGAAEFIDGKGTPWDVKGFHSERPVQEGGFLLSRAIEKIEGEIAGGQNVILDDRKLSAVHAEVLAQFIAKQEWSSRIRWYHGN